MSAQATQYPDFQAALRQAVADRSKDQASMDVLKSVYGGLGLGLLGGGAYATARLLSRPDKKLKQRLQPTEVELPTPTKTASITGGITQAAAADNAYEPSQVWWRNPLAITGGLTAALVAGKGMKGIADGIGRRTRQKKEDEARQEFERALSASLTPKAASDDETLGDKLVRVFATLQKRADFSDTVSSLLKGYGTYAGVAGLGAGVLAYQHSADRNRKALKEALKARQRQRAQTQPTELILPNSLLQPPVAGAGTE